MSVDSQAKWIAAACAGAAAGCIATVALSRSFERAPSRSRTMREVAPPMPQLVQANSQEFKGWTDPKVEKAGTAQGVTLISTLPYTVQPHDLDSSMLMTTCNIYRAPTITAMVHDILQTREVAGIPGVMFGDIVDLILDKGASRVYAAGGFLRDAFCDIVSDDMDFLLRSTGGSLVPFLESVSKARKWPVYRKIDEKTNNPRWDFIAIGQEDAKMKWSAHPCGSGCEGDFCCNSMIYDIKSGALIDPTGHGIQDSVNFILRHNRANFQEWSDEDRLAGMKLIRYFNFCGRGFSPCDADFRLQVVNEAMKILPTPEGKTTIGVFLKRKVFRGTLEKSIDKENGFRMATITEITKAGKSKAEAWAFYLNSVASQYGKHLTKFAGLADKLEATLRQQSESQGVSFSKTW